MELLEIIKQNFIELQELQKTLRREVAEVEKDAKKGVEDAKKETEIAKKEADIARKKAEEAKEKAEEALVSMKEGFAELRLFMQKSSEDLRESQREMNKQLGGIGNSNGEFAESFFYYSLKKEMKLGDIRFDEIDNNVKHRRKQLVDEFDVVLYNGDSIGIVEVKYNATAAHVKRLTTTKVNNFKILFPEYEGFKLYLGIAGLSFENESVKTSAKEAGVAVLEVQGDHLATYTDGMRAY